jgi:hypothetical protein
LARCKKFALGERKFFALPKSFTITSPPGRCRDTRGTDGAPAMTAAQGWPTEATFRRAFDDGGLSGDNGPPLAATFANVKIRTIDLTRPSGALPAFVPAP